MARTNLMLSVQHLQHEAMKVYPCRAVFARLEAPRQGGVEEVHEHRFPRPDGAVEVQAFGHLVEGDDGRGGRRGSAEEFTKLPRVEGQSWYG